VDAVGLVKTENTVQGFDRNGFGVRGEGGGLAKGTAETAAPRREQDANRNGPAAGETEFTDERGMLDFVQGSAEKLGQGFFVVGGEDMIENGLDRWSERPVVARPELPDASVTGFTSHVENVVRFFEVEGETDGIPSLAQSRGILGPGRILEDGNAGNVLTEEAETERDAARHAEAPAKIARSVFTEVIV